MRVLAALLALCVALANASTLVHLNATKDATVSYNYFPTDNGTYEAYTPKGNDPTLVAYRSSEDYRRILLGYTLPTEVTQPSQITKCSLNVPRPIRAANQNYTLIAYSVSGDWDEATVNAGTKLTTDEQLGSANFTRVGDPGSIDILGACQAASGGQFSVFVDSSRALVAFYARDTGRDTFSVDLTY